MKKIVGPIFAAILCTAFFQCKPKTVTPSVSGNPASEFRKTLGTMHPDDQRAILAGLPAQMKYLIWQDHFASSIENEESAEGKVFLKEIADLLKPEAYVDSLRDNFIKSNNVVEIPSRALKVFNNDTARVISYLFLLGKKSDQPAIIKAGGPLKDCDCSTVADRCWIYVSTCVNGNCSSTSWGCGTSQLIPCDGHCR